MMRKLLLAVGAALALTVSAGAAFADVPEEHWAAEPVEAAVARHMVTGYPDGTFRPSETVSRGQLLAMVLRSVDPGGIDRPAEGEAWWQPYFDAAVALGLPLPEDGDLDAPATRREMAALLVAADARCNGLQLTEGWAEPGRFSDETLPDAAAAAASGLLAGYPDGTFRGDKPVTRAESCTAILRFAARADWLADNERQVAYTGRVLIKERLRDDGSAVLTSVLAEDGSTVQTMAVNMDGFQEFPEQRREDSRLWAETWGQTACGADRTAFWGELGYYTYDEDGVFRQWTDRAVYSWQSDGDAVVAVSHAPGARPYFSGGGLAYRPCGDQVIRVGQDGAVEVLLDSRPAHGLHLTAVTGVDAAGIRVRSEEIWGMSDHHAWEYALADGKLRPLIHEPGSGYSGFTPEEAAAEQQRLNEIGL